MELVKVEEDLGTHTLFFETESQNIEIRFEWRDRYVRELIIPVELQPTAEGSVRASVSQYGFYSDDFARVKLFKKSFEYVVSKYSYPITFTSLNLPNRELIIVSWTNSFSKDEAEQLIKTLIGATIDVSDKQTALEEVADTTISDEEIIIQDDSIEEILDVEDDTERIKNFEEILIETREDD